MTNGTPRLRPADAGEPATEAPPQELLDELANTVRSLKFAALDSALSFEEADALFNRANEIRKRMITLEAKRFNAAAKNFQSAVNRLNKAIADLNEELQDIKDIERLLMKATKVFSEIGKLVGFAAKTAAGGLL